MSEKIIQTAGWILTLALTLLIAFSAYLKLTQNEAAIAQAASVNLDAGTYQFIGILEISSLILFLIPRTGILGTLLLIAYMGGAIATHLQHGQPVVVAAVVQIVLWLTAIIRFPELRQRLFIRPGEIKIS